MTSLNFLLRPVAYINSCLQRTRKLPQSLITYSGGWDGGGAQVHSIISILLFAHEFGLKYIHTPLANVEHFKESRDEWSLKWENFFNLGFEECQIDNLDPKLTKSNIRRSLLLWKKPETLFVIRNCHSYTDSFASNYCSIIPALKRKYNQTEKKSIDFIPGKLRVCLHIRRGDVSNKNKQAFRFTPDPRILQDLDFLFEILNDSKRNYQLYIFSQGDSASFNAYSKHNPVLLLNVDEFVTFHSLVQADILFTAKSSFSYVAGLLTAGLVLYEPFWHKPIKGWLNRGMDKKELKKKILQQKNIHFPK